MCGQSALQIRIGRRRICDPLDLPARDAVRRPTDALSAQRGRRRRLRRRRCAAPAHRPQCAVWRRRINLGFRIARRVWRRGTTRSPWAFGRRPTRAPTSPTCLNANTPDVFDICELRSFSRGVSLTLLRSPALRSAHAARAPCVARMTALALTRMRHAARTLVSLSFYGRRWTGGAEGRRPVGRRK